MKQIIGTQIGLIIGSILCIVIFNQDIDLILYNFVILNLGYFWRVWQDHMKIKNK